MENYSVSISKHQPESPDRAYSDDSPVRHESSTYADDPQYFDIDISLPLSPADITPVASSDDDDTEDEFDLDSFDLDSFFCRPKPLNPNQCISPPGENLIHQGQVPPLDDTDKDIPFPQSCNVPGVKIQFPKLLRTATKLKISLLGFKKSAKPGTDSQSPCAEPVIAMDSPVPKQNRLVTLKLKVVEVPLVSLFTRDNSNGSKRVDNNHRLQKKSEDTDDTQGQCKNMDREKKGTKEIVQKYVQKIKPLYLKISQRYNERMRFRDLEKSGEKNGVKIGRSPGSERKLEKQMSLSYFSGNLKMIHKQLGKGKHQPSDRQQKLLRNYCSESTLMEIESAIQGAISHCKQSSCIYDTVTRSNSGCSAESSEGSDGR